ncbi:hypothetical protein [Cellulomonas sp. Marseille-Q8402]
MRSSWVGAALAGGLVLLLAACTGGTTEAPDPTTTAAPTTAAGTPAPQGPPVVTAAQEAFVAAVAEDLGRDSSGIAAVLVEQGAFICQTLAVGAEGLDDAVAVYRQYFAEDDGTAGPLWDNAVRYLCPELVDDYEAVLDRAAAGG